VRHLEKKRVVIFAGGDRESLFFDGHRRGAARGWKLRRRDPEGHARDGVYDADPEQIPDAKFFAAISYREVLNQT